MQRGRGSLACLPRAPLSIRSLTLFLSFLFFFPFSAQTVTRSASAADQCIAARTPGASQPAGRCQLGLAPFGSRRASITALLLAFALLLRVAVVVLLHTSHAAPVTYEHGAIAASLLEGRGFSIRFLGVEGPTSQQAPLYPTLLAGCYALLGIETPAAILAMQLLQCLVGTSIVAATMQLSEVCFPRSGAARWSAGIIAAAFPVHLYAVTHIQVCLWVAALLAWLVVLWARTVASPRYHRLRYVAVGALAGGLLLFEPIMALPVAILALATARNTRQHSASLRKTTPAATATGTPRVRIGRFSRLAARAGAGAFRAVRGFRAAPGMGPALLFLGGCLLVVAPWIYRNWRVHGEPVFIKSTFGYAFWQGNNPLSWGTDKVPKPSAERLRRKHDHTLRSIDRALWEARHETIYIDDLLLKPTGYASLRGLSEPARSRRLGHQAMRFICGHPDHYLRLCGRRFRYFLLWDDTNPKAAHWLYRLTTLVWLAFVACGFLLAQRAGHTRVAPVVLAIFAALLVFHTLTITSARFRIPVEPLTFPWAGYAMARLLTWLSTLGRLVTRSVVPTATT